MSKKRKIEFRFLAKKTVHRNVTLHRTFNNLVSRKIDCVLTFCRVFQFLVFRVSKGFYKMPSSAYNNKMLTKQLLDFCSKLNQKILCKKLQSCVEINKQNG